MDHGQPAQPAPPAVPAPPPQESRSQQYCTFHVGQLFFGIEVEKVQEVLRYQEMTRVPLAPREIRGLINLRGQIVTAIDMRRRLQLEDRMDGKQSMNVVLRDDEGSFSFLVDSIGDVVTVTEDSFEEPPPTMRGLLRSLLVGVYKMEGRLLLILDAERAGRLESLGSVQK